MVYDIEYGRSLIERADDFLDNRPSITMSSDMESQLTKGGSKVSFMKQNRNDAFTKNPNNRLNRNKERLDPAKQLRYDQLLKDIDANLEAILKDKEDYQRNLGNDNHSQMSRFTTGSNVYSIEGEQKSVFEALDMRIRQCNPDAQILPLQNL